MTISPDAYDRWLTTDPRGELDAEFEAWCAETDTDPADADAWSEFEADRERGDWPPDYDPDPDDEPYYDDPSLDYR